MYLQDAKALYLLVGVLVSCIFWSPSSLFAESSAQLEDNLKTCLDGRYPALCKHSLLTGQQQVQVRNAEQFKKTSTFANLGEGVFSNLEDYRNLEDSSLGTVNFIMNMGGGDQMNLSAGEYIMNMGGGMMMNLGTGDLTISLD